MSQLPVIVGFGGINAAGRSSFHQGYRRLILDALPLGKKQNTLVELGRLMRLGSDLSDTDLLATHESTIRRHTLMRRIESTYFDVDAMPLHHHLRIQGEPLVSPLVFQLRKRNLPHHIPANWQISALDDEKVQITVSGDMETLIPDTQRFPVSSAGQIPSGFDPATYYPSRHHPRALQLTVFGASDALHSMGVAWDELRQKIAPDRIAVYASSAHGQLDDFGTGGMMKSLWQGKRNTAKQCPLGFAEMPADFINAYILGSVGKTGGTLGACATFLYNLERAVSDIREGRIDFALVGAAEAPILPEVMEGYRAMGALGEDHKLLELDRAKGLTKVDNTRATRPFGYNCGFTMGESAQFVVVTSDRFALENGLPIHGSVPDIFIHADGFKKSISAPGIGNYLSLGKSVSLARDILGEKLLRTATHIQAHGTGTPQNRVTESDVFDRIAGTFSIENWLVASVKCYVGHSLGAAAGDQFMAALGTWQDGVVPGIFTLDEIAHDVHREHLHFSQSHVECGVTGMAASFINSKGFGGNNATALLLSPSCTMQMLQNRYGKKVMTQWQHALEQSESGRENYREITRKGLYQPIYRFGEHVLEGENLLFSENAVSLPENELSVTLDYPEKFAAYRENTPSEKE